MLDAIKLVFGNGSNEVLELVAHVFSGARHGGVMGQYGFVVYKLATLLMGARPVEVAMPRFAYDLAAMRAAVTPRTRVVFLDNPNNPTGPHIPRRNWPTSARSLPDDVLLVLDEAYAEYQDAAPDFRP